MAENLDSLPVPYLDDAVARRIVSELGDRAGGRVLRCLRAAAELIRLSQGDDEFRFAESAAYNLREALDAVIRDRPAAEGGLRAALDAWDRYKLACAQPDADEPAARAELGSALDRFTRDGRRQAFMTRKLLDWFRQQTGVSPLAGDGDPMAQYQRLRDAAQSILHTDAAAAEVSALHQDAVAWFTRLFAPPSDVARRLAELAALPYTSERGVELRSLALNVHHVRLFLHHLADPAWLEPMRQSGLIGLPVAGEPWPVAALTSDDRRVADTVVAGVLEQMVDDLVSLPAAHRPGAAFEIARTACWLGHSGYPIVAELARQYPDDHGVRVLAGTASKGLDSSNPAQLVIADALIGNGSRREGAFLTRRLVAQLVDGMTSTNVDERFELMAFKLRRLADRERFLALDIVALSAEADDQAEAIVHVARSLVLAIGTARDLGLATSAILDSVGLVTGELGQRLVCQALSGATDVDRGTKLAHLAARLASETATGDDQALIEDLSPMGGEEIEFLKTAFGTPATVPVDAQRIDRDAARAWRWSMLLPAAVLAGWEDAIEAATARHGPPDFGALGRRMPTSGAMFGSSPISHEELAALAPLDASALAARWRPSPTDRWGVSARQLARTLKTIVKERPQDWTADPVATVRTLREPVYIDHYLRGLKAIAKEVVGRADAIVAAISVVRTEQWEPTAIGADDFDFDEDWSQVNISAVELIDALADADADFKSELAYCWQLVLQLAHHHPDDTGPVDQYHDTKSHDDPLHHAINGSHGRALHAAIALGGWEFRRTGEASDLLTTSLTSVLSVEGAIGLQLRAVIAASRTFIEAIASEWLDQHHATLFGDVLGSVTFDQTLKYSRPTPIFFDRSLDKLLSAARRGAPNAVTWLLIGYLHDVPGYSFSNIVRGLARDAHALAEVAGEIARLSIDVPIDQGPLTLRGLDFWEQMLGEAGQGVPVTALAGSGRWALGKNLAADRWIELTKRTVELAGGVIDCACEVAERCRDLQPEPTALSILAAIAGHGEQWEQYRIEEIGVEALRAAAAGGFVGDTFRNLRERLIQRGRHDAAEIGPPD